MKYIIITLATILCSVMGHAQVEEAITKALESKPNMDVQSDVIKLNKETQNGYFVYLNASKDVAEKQWKNFLEKKYLADVKKSKNGFLAMEVNVPSITAYKLNITAVFVEDENGSKMNAFFDLGGKYISPKEQPSESKEVQTFLKEFQKQLYMKVYEDVIATQRKEQEGATKDLEKLVKEEEGLSGDIAKEEKNINNAEEDIIESEKKITELQAKMESLRGEIKESQSTIKELVQAKEKKAKEVASQKTVVAAKTAQIQKLKSSSDSMNN